MTILLDILTLLVAVYVGEVLWSFGEAALEYAGPGTGVKTAGTYVVKNGKTIVSSVKSYSKSSFNTVKGCQSATMRYIGITDDIIDQAMQKFFFVKIVFKIP